MEPFGFSKENILLTCLTILFLKKVLIIWFQVEQIVLRVWLVECRGVEPLYSIPFMLPFASLHPNAGAQLRSELLLLPPYIINPDGHDHGEIYIMT